MSKFKRGDVVRHKTGTLYEILFGPNEGLMIEGGLQPAYIYRELVFGVALWVRPAFEMEDGRFELVKDPPMPRQTAYRTDVNRFGVVEIESAGALRVTTTMQWFDRERRAHDWAATYKWPEYAILTAHERKS